MIIFVCISILSYIFPTALSCCSPKTWEGIQGLQAGVVKNGVPSHEESQNLVSYDAINERIVANNGNGQIVLEDFKKGLMYVVVNGSCTISKIPKTMREACSGPGAVAAQNAYFGWGGNLINVTTWAWQQAGLMVYYTVTPDDCLPVTETVHGTTNGVYLTQIKAFMNMTSYIKDPSVFDVPDSCNNIIDSLVHSSHGDRVFG